MFKREPAAKRRLRGALSLSLLVTPAVIVVSILLRRSAVDYKAELAFMWVGLVVGIMALLSVAALAAGLIEHRPAWHDPLARRAWIWAAISFATLGYLGLTGSQSQTVGAVVLYAAGLCAICVGGLGLVIAAIPPRRKHAQ